MADSRLRSHERRAAQSGDTESHARLIAERLRSAPRCSECGGEGRAAFGPGTILSRGPGGALKRCEAGETPAAVVGMGGELLTSGRMPFGYAATCSACAGTGSPYGLRVEAAAYSGSEAARMALDVPPLAPEGLADWLMGLASYGQEAQVAAALGAARARLAVPECPGTHGLWHALPSGACACGYGYDAHVNPDKSPRLDRRRSALLATGEWLSCPCNEHREEWARRYGEATGWPSIDFDPDWLPHPLTDPPDAGGLGHWLGHPQGSAAVIRHNTQAPVRAARIIGAPAARSAASECVIRWALGDA